MGLKAGYLRRAIAMLCMALAFLLSSQTFISVTDRVEHARHHLHFANPLAGDVQFCGGVHDGCGLHHHHHHAGDVAADHDNNGSPGHQHGDAVIMFIVTQTFVVPGCALVAIRCDLEPRGLTGIKTGGIERPPKTYLEYRV